MSFAYNVAGKADFDDMTAELRALQKEIRQMAAASAKQTKEVADSFDTLSGRIGGAFNAVTAAASAFGTVIGVGGLFEQYRAMTVAGQEAAAATQEFADSLGVSSEEFSKATIALSEFGLAQEDVFDVMGELQQKAVNNAGDFARWGIATRDASGNFADSITLLERMAERTSKLSDETQQMALADELLSDNGRKLVGVLRQGGDAFRGLLEDAVETGAVITAYEARVGESLVRQQRIAESQTKALGSAINSILGPSLTLIQAEIGKGRAETAEWIRTNEDFLNQKLDEYLATIAQVWLPRITSGVIFASRSVRGFALLWDFLRLLAVKAFTSVADGLAQVLDMAARAADFVGAGGLSGELQDMADTQKFVANGFRIDQDKVTKSMEDSLDAQIQLEASLRSFGDGAAAALERVRNRLSSYRDELRQAAEQQDDFKRGTMLVADADEVAKRRQIENLKSLQAQYAAYMAERRELEAQRAEEARLSALRWSEAMQQIEAQRQALKGAMLEGASMVRGFVQQAIDGTLTFASVATAVGNKLIDVLLEYLANLIAAKATEAAITSATAKANITANAAEAASGAAKSQAGIPFVGPILAVAAMGAMLAAVLALTSNFNQGGLVRGISSANRDTVPAMLTAGELVVDRDTTARLQALLGGNVSPAAAATSGPPAAVIPPSRSSSGGPMVMLSTMVPPESRAEQERVSRRLSKALRRRGRGA